MTYEIKEPDAPATKKQTWTIFKLGGGDVRNDGLTRKQASDMIGKLIAEKEAGDANKPSGPNFQEIFDKAYAAGKAAALAYDPIPMRVEQHANPLDDSSPVVKDWIVNDGVCGFAWINVRPGNCSFANWLKKNNLARKSYDGGVDIWISEYNQSHGRKCAHACSMANVLEDELEGVRIYVHERLD